VVVVVPISVVKVLISVVVVTGPVVVKVDF
jgi:hypothetical protein